MGYSMFEPKTLGGAVRGHRSLDSHSAFLLKRPASPGRTRGFFTSVTCGVREFAYVIIDVVIGRYDR